MITYKKVDFNSARFIWGGNRSTVSCLFCRKTAISADSYWLMGYASERKISSTASEYSGVKYYCFCDEMCFNCWVLKNDK